MTPTDTSPAESPTAAPTPPWAEDQVILDGDYETVVGNDPAAFLSSCSDALAPAVCIRVERGSIIVTIVAENLRTLTETISDITTNGLQVVGFPALPSVTQSPTPAPTPEEVTVIVTVRTTKANISSEADADAAVTQATHVVMAALNKSATDFMIQVTYSSEVSVSTDAPNQNVQEALEDITEATARVVESGSTSLTAATTAAQAATATVLVSTSTQEAVTRLVSTSSAPALETTEQLTAGRRLTSCTAWEIKSSTKVVLVSASELEASLNASLDTAVRVCETSDPSVTVEIATTEDGFVDQRVLESELATEGLAETIITQVAITATTTETATTGTATTTTATATTATTSTTTTETSTTTTLLELEMQVLLYPPNRSELLVPYMLRVSDLEAFVSDSGIAQALAEGLAVLAERPSAEVVNVTLEQEVAGETAAGGAVAVLFTIESVGPNFHEAETLATRDLIASKSGLEAWLAFRAALVSAGYREDTLLLVTGVPVVGAITEVEPAEEETLVATMEVTVIAAVATVALVTIATSAALSSAAVGAGVAASGVAGVAGGGAAFTGLTGIGATANIGVAGGAIGTGTTAGTSVAGTYAGATSGVGATSGATAGAGAGVGAGGIGAGTSTGVTTGATGGGATGTTGTTGAQGTTQAQAAAGDQAGEGSNHNHRKPNEQPPWGTYVGKDGSEFTIAAAAASGGLVASVFFCCRKRKAWVTDNRNNRLFLLDNRSNRQFVDADREVQVRVMSNMHIEVVGIGRLVKQLPWYASYFKFLPSLVLLLAAIGMLLAEIDSTGWIFLASSILSFLSIILLRPGSAIVEWIRYLEELPPECIRERLWLTISIILELVPAAVAFFRGGVLGFLLGGLATFFAFARHIVQIDWLSRVLVYIKLLSSFTISSFALTLGILEKAEEMLHLFLPAVLLFLKGVVEWVKKQAIDGIPYEQGLELLKDRALDLKGAAEEAWRDLHLTKIHLDVLNALKHMIPLSPRLGPLLIKTLKVMMGAMVTMCVVASRRAIQEFMHNSLEPLKKDIRRLALDARFKVAHAKQLKNPVAERAVAQNLTEVFRKIVSQALAVGVDKCRARAQKMKEDVDKLFGYADFADSAITFDIFALVPPTKVVGQKANNISTMCADIKEELNTEVEADNQQQTMGTRDLDELARRTRIETKLEALRNEVGRAKQHNEKLSSRNIERGLHKLSSEVRPLRMETKEAFTDITRFAEDALVLTKRRSAYFNNSQSGILPLGSQQASSMLDSSDGADGRYLTNTGTRVTDLERSERRAGTGCWSSDRGIRSDMVRGVASRSETTDREIMVEGNHSMMATLSHRSQGMAHTLSQRSHGVAHMLTQRSQGILSAMGQRSQQMAAAMSQRVQGPWLPSSSAAAPVLAETALLTLIDNISLKAGEIEYAQESIAEVIMGARGVDIIGESTSEELQGIYPSDDENMFQLAILLVARVRGMVVLTRALALTLQACMENFFLRMDQTESAVVAGSKALRNLEAEFLSEASDGRKEVVTEATHGMSAGGQATPQGGEGSPFGSSHGSETSGCLMLDVNDDEPAVHYAHDNEASLSSEALRGNPLQEEPVAAAMQVLGPLVIFLSEGVVVGAEIFTTLQMSKLLALISGELVKFIPETLDLEVDLDLDIQDMEDFQVYGDESQALREFGGVDVGTAVALPFIVDTALRRDTPEPGRRLSQLDEVDEPSANTSEDEALEAHVAVFPSPTLVPTGSPYNLEDPEAERAVLPSATLLREGSTLTVQATGPLRLLPAPTQLLDSPAASIPLGREETSAITHEAPVVHSLRVPQASNRPSRSTSLGSVSERMPETP